MLVVLESHKKPFEWGYNLTIVLEAFLSTHRPTPPPQSPPHGELFQKYGSLHLGVFFFYSL
jgi:hypothetical protein